MIIKQYLIGLVHDNRHDGSMQIKHVISEEANNFTSRVAWDQAPKENRAAWGGIGTRTTESLGAWSRATSRDFNQFQDFFLHSHCNLIALK